MDVKNTIIKINFDQAEEVAGWMVSNGYGDPFRGETHKNIGNIRITSKTNSWFSSGDEWYREMNPDYTFLTFSQFKSKYMSQKISFPFSIHCRDLHERDAAAAWLVSHGCLVQGEEDHLNGKYKKNFISEMDYLIVHTAIRFGGNTAQGREESYTFYENVDKLSEAFNTIKVGDWVVGLNSSPSGGYSEGKLYKVREISDVTIRTELDNKNSKDNGWGIKNFRKATEEETEAKRLPTINNHQGKIIGSIIKYGCAEIDESLIEEASDLMNGAFDGNQKVVGVTLCSGVVISKEEVEQIAKACK